MSRVHDDENVRGIMFQIQYLTHQGAEIGGHFPNQTWSTFLHTYFYPQLQFLLNKHRSLLLCLSSPSLTLKKKKSVTVKTTSVLWRREREDEGRMDSSQEMNG